MNLFRMDKEEYRKFRIFINIMVFIAFLAVFAHLIFLKYAGWIEWFGGKTQKTPNLANPQYPPASLFVFLIMAGIIGYRIYLKLKHDVQSHG